MTQNHIFKMPSQCCRCLGSPETSWEVHASGGPEGGFTSTTARFEEIRFSVPICNECKKFYKKWLYIFFGGSLACSILGIYLAQPGSQFPDIISMLMIIIGFSSLFGFGFGYSKGLFLQPAHWDFINKRIRFKNAKYQELFDRANA
jgi:hypothetical protein